MLSDEVFREFANRCTPNTETGGLNYKNFGRMVEDEVRKQMTAEAIHMQMAAMSGIGSNNNNDNGWLEAAIAWEVCASLHRQYCEGKDDLFTTRQSDFVKHAENARRLASRGQAPKQS